jgi:hypothetical protein
MNNKSLNRDNTFNLLTENKRKKNERTNSNSSSANKYRLSDIKYSLQAAPILINLPRKKRYKTRKNKLGGSNNRKTKRKKTKDVIPKAEIKHTHTKVEMADNMLTTRLVFLTLYLLSLIYTV